MEVDPPPYEPSTRRCPCCDGQGELIFGTCKHCGLVNLGCAEVGTVFANARNLDLSTSVSIDAPCPKCGAPVGYDRPSTPEEIRRAGFSEAEFRRSGPPPQSS